MAGIDQGEGKFLLKSGDEDVTKQGVVKKADFDPEKTLDEPVEAVRDQLLQSGNLRSLFVDQTGQTEVSDSAYMEGEMPTVKLPRISAQVLEKVDHDEPDLSQPTAAYLNLKKRFFDLTAADVSTNYGVLRGGKLRMDVESLQKTLFAALDEYFSAIPKPEYPRMYSSLLLLAGQFAKLKPNWPDVLNDAATALSWAQLRSALVHPSVIQGDVKERYPEFVRQLAGFDGLHLFDRGMYAVMANDGKMHLREDFGSFHLNTFSDIVADDRVWQSPAARPLFEAITYVLREIESCSDPSVVELMKALLYQKNMSLKPPSKVINNLLLGKQ